jgi:hypothetical protein
MYGPVIVLAAFAVLIAGGLSWLVAVRFGVLWALALPVVALVALIGMRWASTGIDFHDGIGSVVATAVFALPTLVGVLIGTGLAVLFRRRKDRSGP